jgi:hypothetical protein
MKDTTNMKLTDIKCKNAKPMDPPSKAPRKLADGNGLYLWVMPTGKKYWRYRYKDMRGKCREFAIGVYGGEHTDFPWRKQHKIGVRILRIPIKAERLRGHLRLL